MKSVSFLISTGQGAFLNVLQSRSNGLLPSEQNVHRILPNSRGNRLSFFHHQTGLQNRRGVETRHA